MLIQMPAVKQTPTSAYNATLIQHDKVFVHMAEGGSAGGVAWLCSGRVKASTHLFMNEAGDIVYQLVPLQYEAWAECAFNRQGVSMEIPGFTAQGVPAARWRSAALIVAWLCRAYAIPPTWAQGGLGRGVCQHADLGLAGGGHHDACGVGSQTWFTFLGYVKAAFDAFGDAPLPPFALHGAPGPHLVEAPPFVPPEPTHGGAARNMDGDIIAHPTPSGFALHTIAALQSDLNALGAAPILKIDGAYGPATQDALRVFQTKHGLTRDGLIGPNSWAAVDAAMRT